VLTNYQDESTFVITMIKNYLMYICVNCAVQILHKIVYKTETSLIRCKKT